jgi:hypothetical protein
MTTSSQQLTYLLQDSLRNCPRGLRHLFRRLGSTGIFLFNSGKQGVAYAILVGRLTMTVGGEAVVGASEDV